MSGNESQMRYRHLIVFCKQTKRVQREVETIDVSINKKKKVSTEALEGEYVIECKYRSLIRVDCNLLGKGRDLILNNVNVKLGRLIPTIHHHLQSKAGVPIFSLVLLPTLLRK